MLNKELALSNIIANQALEGVTFSDEKIERCKAILDGEITGDEAVAQIIKNIT